jgi:hypothetical protein
MRLNSTHRRFRKRSWTLIFSWSVFWAIIVLAPFCSGWATIEVAASHAAHHATPAPANDDHNPAQGGTQCCHTVSDASALDPKPELSQSAIALWPIATGAWTAVAAASAPGIFIRVAPAPRPSLPVFLSTRRLRI